MNIDVELSVSLKIKDDPAAVAPEKRRVVAAVLERIAAHPWVAIIVRELMRRT